MSHTESASSEFALRRSPRLLGMSNPGSGVSPSPLIRTRLRGTSSPERGSSQFASRKSPRLLGKLGIRKSPRLLGKSAMTMPKLIQISPRKSPANKGKSAMTMPKRSQISPRKSPAKGKSAMTMPESPRKSPAKGVIGHQRTSSTRGYPDIHTIMRSNREHAARHFRRHYTYSEVNDTKTCIHPNGEFSWEDKSCGFTWVAVRGVYTTCVVFIRTLKHVQYRLSSYLRNRAPEKTFSLFGKTVTSEIEVLADLPKEKRQRFKRREHIHRPFAIVSVDPYNFYDPIEKDHEEAAVEYLKAVLKTVEVFYSAETQEAAIRAFQLLYNKKFEPDDIWVSTSCLGEDDNLPRSFIKYHLGIINQTGEYKGHAVAAINKPDSGGAPEIITNKPDSGGSCSAPR